MSSIALAWWSWMPTNTSTCNWKEPKSTSNFSPLSTGSVLVCGTRETDLIVSFLISGQCSKSKNCCLLAFATILVFLKVSYNSSYFLWRGIDFDFCVRFHCEFIALSGCLTEKRMFLSNGLPDPLVPTYIALARSLHLDLTEGCSLVGNFHWSFPNPRRSLSYYLHFFCRCASAPGKLPSRYTNLKFVLPKRTIVLYGAREIQSPSIGSGTRHPFMITTAFFKVASRALCKSDANASKSSTSGWNLKDVGSLRFFRYGLTHASAKSLRKAWPLGSSTASRICPPESASECNSTSVEGTC